MSKDKLISQLENTKNNYILALQSEKLFRNPLAINQVEYATLRNILIDKNNDTDILLNEYEKNNYRNVISPSIELIKQYCIKTGQLDIFHKSELFCFVKVFRNALVHDFKFNFHTEEIKKLPLKWRGYTLNQKLQGIDVKFHHLKQDDLPHLIEDLEKEIKSKLN
jgi:hypothetical protein